ncbi:MAG: DUF2889 domain-containing protein [Acidimicrobiia bacterium]|nr:DUF2889 domain-containing protein [Acidimicrobiia bacterium]
MTRGAEPAGGGHGEPFAGATVPRSAGPDVTADAYRRRIRLTTTEPGLVVGGLEDDMHHFRVRLRHDGRRVVAITAEAPRSPWTTCPDAGIRLRDLEGVPLFERATGAAAHADPRAHCTHLFDLAGLAVAHAAAGRTRRQYDAEVPVPVDSRARVRLWRDGAPVLSWTLEGGRVVDPPLYARAPWEGGFLRWADTTLDPDGAEAAGVLRRACRIGLGRGMDLDRIATADELGALMTGICYTMQPERIGHARRNRGTIRDFGDRPDDLLGRPGDPA